jgi:adenylate cyclase
MTQTESKEIEAWIIEQGLCGSSISTLVSGLAARLVEGGIPLLRAYLALPTINPMYRAMNFSWTRFGGPVVAGVLHERGAGALENSPLGFLMRANLPSRHWRLDDPDAQSFAIFDVLREIGAADYFLRLVRFGTDDGLAMEGVAFAFSTDRPSGLSADEIARIDALLPLVALSAYRIALFDLAGRVLDTYVGLSAGRRVLNGEIRHGTGQTLAAALLIADLRGFTTLADHGGADLIALLDQHLEAMVGAVMARGGEVLKFLGDGLLAAFPIDAGRSREDACRTAVEAALDALARNRAVNAAHPDESRLDLDVALHCGDVFYGNIGTPERLDFTVIGPAVNEVSRMEALCGPLGCALVLSQSIAGACARETRSLGRHRLRGLAEERELFTLA